MANEKITQAIEMGSKQAKEVFEARKSIFKDRPSLKENNTPIKESIQYSLVDKVSAPSKMVLTA